MLSNSEIELFICALRESKFLAISVRERDRISRVLVIFVWSESRT